MWSKLVVSQCVNVESPGSGCKSTKIYRSIHLDAEMNFWWSTFTIWSPKNIWGNSFADFQPFREVMMCLFLLTLMERVAVVSQGSLREGNYFWEMESSSGKKWDFQLWTECQVCLTLSACGETTIWSEFSANNLKILSLPSLKSTFSQPVLMCWWGSESWCNYNFHLSKLCDVIFMLCGVISLVTYYRVHLKFHSWGWKGFKGFSLKLLSIFNISLHNTSE